MYSHKLNNISNDIHNLCNQVIVEYLHNNKQLLNQIVEEYYIDNDYKQEINNYNNIITTFDVENCTYQEFIGYIWARYGYISLIYEKKIKETNTSVLKRNHKLLYKTTKKFVKMMYDEIAASEEINYDVIYLMYSVVNKLFDSELEEIK
jgi:hypothetical protein